MTETKSTHTPGPWTARTPQLGQAGPGDSIEVYTEAPGVGINTSHHGYRTIAICSHRDRRFAGSYDERSANARLIAAAPEMVALIQRYLTDGGFSDWSLKEPQFIRDARALLARIEGA